MGQTDWTAHLEWSRRMLAEAEARGDDEDVIDELKRLVAEDAERAARQREDR